jgi:hypothetical protein
MLAVRRIALRTVVITYTVITAVVAVVAVAVVVAFGDDLEQWHQVPFPELPATASEVGSILLHNGRVLLAAIGAALAVNAPWLTRPGELVDQSPGWRAARALCDVVLMLGVARNLVTVGVGLAVYRERMVLAILPHGPVELAAFSCGLSLYLLARRGPVERSVWLALAGAAVMLLAIAAVLEVFVVF